MEKKRRLFWAVFVAAAFFSGLLAGCTNGERVPEGTLPAEETFANVESLPVNTERVEPSESLPPSREPLTVSDRGMMKEELAAAIRELRQPGIMDISAAGLEEPEMDVKNLYYEILSEFPELKYAFDLEVEAGEGKLVCTISYMPYKTGEFPTGFSGEKAGSVRELLAVAERHLGEEEAAVQITDRELEPDRMNRVLQQVGGGYLYCALNRDATAIQYSPPAGMTLEDCMKALASADKLASQVVEEVITDGMTQREQAEALYAYLTGNVAYDQRYYSDRTAMPYESQTALGALRDHTAICGGYANALKLLYEKVGIPCYIVSGKYFREYHAWNVALLEGEWLWFDATTDRGNTGEFGFLRFALAELDAMKYHYEAGDVEALTAP